MKKNTPVPVALSESLLARIDHAASQADRSRSELMRLAMEIGLKHLANIDHDLAQAVLTTSELAAAAPKSALPFKYPIVKHDTLLEQVAELLPEYGTPPGIKLSLEEAALVQAGDTAHATGKTGTHPGKLAARPAKAPPAAKRPRQH